MSTDNLITNTRRKRSKSFPPSSSTPLPVQDSSSNTVVSLNRSLLRTDTGKIDASILSVEQMQYMSECEKHMYEKLDFTRCKDDVIYFPWKVATSQYIEFCWLQSRCRSEAL
jgi:hypothetical protein